MTNFISQYLDYTKELESPESFWRWSAYSIVSAYLRDSVYLEQKLRRTYPNMYVLLLATSANHRKSGPFAPVEELLTHEKLSRTKLFKGRASIQAIIDGLSLDEVKKGSVRKATGGSGIVLSEELSSSFVEDPALIPILTDMYDFKKTFEYRLKGAGVTEIRNLCFSMFSASNMQLLKRVFSTNAVLGGLLGRTSVVVPGARRPPNSLTSGEGKDQGAFDNLIASLEKIGELKGQVTIDEKAQKLYDEWYIDHYNNVLPNETDGTGVAGRVHASVLKLALVLACADYRMTIQEDDMLEALSQQLSLRPNYTEFTMISGRGPEAEIGTVFLMALRDAPKHTLSLREFLFRHFNETNTEEMDTLTRTLENAGIISIVLSSTAKSFTLTPKGLNIILGKGGKK